MMILFLLVNMAFAEDRVIDLGELKVKGDVRRPSTIFYQLKSLHNSQLLELSDLSFTEFESELLQPAKDKNHE